MRFWVLCALLAAGVAKADEPFRDSDGGLELKDCGVAKAWRASAPLPRQGDQTRLLYAAYACAKSGEREEAHALQALADALPRNDFLFGTDGDTTRVSIALSLGDLDGAAKLLRSTSEILLDNWSKLEDPMSVMYAAHAMQRLNEDVGMKLRTSDPAGAVVHQLLAARAYDLPDIGMPFQAALCRNVALEIAIEVKLAEPLIAASSAILARPASELTPGQAQGISIAALELLEQKRTEDALALAKRLKATGQADAVRHADQVLRHIER